MSRRRAMDLTHKTRKVRARSRRSKRPHRTSPEATGGTGAPSRAHRRGIGTLTKVVVSLGVVVSALSLGTEWVLHSSILRVQHVRIDGLRHETEASVLAASGLAGLPAMIDVSASSIDRRLTSFAWIEYVSLTKHWPNTVVLTVHERQPVAVAFTAHHLLRFVDAAGRDLGPAPLSANLPTLVYVDPTSATWPFERAGRGAALVASQLPRAFAAQVARVSEDSLGIVTLQMTTPVSFILGPPSNLKAKFVSIASVIAHSTLLPGDVVDVSVPGALAVTGPTLG